MKIRASCFALILSFNAVLALPAKANQIGFQLVIDDGFNTPAFHLTNTSDSLLLTSFTLTIGLVSKNWDYVTTLTSPTGGSSTLNSPDIFQNLVRSDVIDLSFGGFNPFEFISFRADLDADPTSNTVEDFRFVMFNNGASVNSVAMATFSNGQILSLELPDGSTTDASYTFSTSATVPDASGTLGLLAMPALALALVRLRRTNRQC